MSRPPDLLTRGDDALRGASSANTTVIRIPHPNTIVLPEELCEVALHVDALERNLRAIAAGHLAFLDAPGVRGELAAWARAVARRVEMVVA